MESDFLISLFCAVVSTGLSTLDHMPFTHGLKCINPVYQELKNADLDFPLFRRAPKQSIPSMFEHRQVNSGWSSCLLNETKNKFRAPVECLANLLDTRRVVNVGHEHLLNDAAVDGDEPAVVRLQFVAHGQRE